MTMPPTARRRRGFVFSSKPERTRVTPGNIVVTRARTSRRMEPLNRPMRRGWPNLLCCIEVGKEVAIKRRLSATGLMVALCFSLIGCENAQKSAAQAALNLAQKAVDSFEASDAARFLPAQAKDIQSTLAAAKGSFAKRDYSSALAAAKSIPGKVKGASEAWNDQKQEFSAKFNKLDAKMPALSAAVQSRIDALQKSHKLPAGVADGYAQFKNTWAEASSALKSGDYPAAMAMASAAQAQLARVQSALVNN